MSSVNVKMQQVGDELVKCLPEIRAQLFRMQGRTGLDADQIEEVVQETLLRLAQSFAQGREIEDISRYVMAIARNSLMDFMRRQNRLSHRTIQFSFKDWDTAEELSTSSEDAESAVVLKTVQTALQALPNATRQAFLLRTIHGLGTKEIASQLNMSVADVKERIMRTTTYLTRALSLGKPDSYPKKNRDDSK